MDPERREDLRALGGFLVIIAACVFVWAALAWPWRPVPPPVSAGSPLDQVLVFFQAQTGEPTMEYGHRLARAVAVRFVGRDGEALAGALARHGWNCTRNGAQIACGFRQGWQWFPLRLPVHWGLRAELDDAGKISAVSGLALMDF